VRRASGTRATIDVTNSRPPTGGVIMPMVRLTITRMPNCKSSMPSACAIGPRIGTSTMMPGSGSKKMPNASSSRFTATRNASGGRSRLTTHAVSSCGTRDTVSTHANAADIATMISTEAVISAERARIAGSMLQASER
jgi:hypothetical protein